MALALPVLDVGPSVVLVRRHGWAVATRSGAPRGVRLLAVPGGLRLEVADGGTPDRCTRVDLCDDGHVTVRASTTPPAVLVGPDDVSTLPALPGGADRVRLDAGQRLLVLSSDALDALPVSLAAVLQSLPARLADREPHELLRELTADLDVGSAAIVVRESDLRDTSRHLRDTEEGTWGSAVHS